MSVTFSYLAEPVSTAFTIGELVPGVVEALAGKALECAPVLDGDGKYVGMVFLSGLLGDRTGAPDAGAKLDAEMIEMARAFGLDEQLFDNLAAVAEARGGIVPVVDEDGSLEGVVSRSRILKFLADRMHSGEGGYTLEIEVPPSG
ncbi:MAG TPA: CBS domain-containing protein, partial [Chlorobaculum parvum]|nr:CBS domain-containing protein [Chlorobaculum parvum]